MKGTLVSFHELMRNQGYYDVLMFESLTILLTGFLISVALVPFIGWRPWLSISYGLIPWLIIQLLVYARQEFKK
jgi:hypothetical protein